MKIWKIFLVIIILAVLLLAIGVIRKNRNSDNNSEIPVCGNGYCEQNENCPEDCSTNQPNEETPPENEYSLETGDYEFSLVHDGLTRKYFVHVPPSYNPSTPTPLVLNFHGGGGDPENQMTQSGMDAKSDSAGFIVVYPEGTGKSLAGKLFATWNAGRCCGYATENNIDDVGFVSAMLEDLESKFNVDEKKVYSTGLSNGALFSYRLACDLSDKIAAIAPVGAQDSLNDCNQARKVPVMHFHGILDPSAPFEGGHCGGRLSGDPGWDCKSVPDYIEEWRIRNSCSEETETVYEQGEALCVKYKNCEADVILCTMETGGHTWPSGSYSSLGEAAVGKISTDISANDEMWKFFQQHSLN